jgi:hypothetical protein
MLRSPGLKRFAQSIGKSPAQVALAWLLSRDDIIAIPKTGNRDRLRENVGALDLTLSAEQLAALDELFPPRATCSRWRCSERGPKTRRNWRRLSTGAGLALPCLVALYLDVAREIDTCLLARIRGHPIGSLFGAATAVGELMPAIRYDWNASCMTFSWS